MSEKKNYRYVLKYKNDIGNQEGEVELDTMDPHEMLVKVLDLINTDQATLEIIES